MKKRTKQKIKKLIPKIYIWTISIGFAIFLAINSVDSFIRLHNGASMQEVDSRKYQPVFSELLLLIAVAVFLLIALKLINKLSLLLFVPICIIVAMLIGWFGYWAYEYTLQDPAEGFLGVGLFIGFFVVFSAAMLWYESHQRRKRKKQSKKADS